MRIGHVAMAAAGVAAGLLIAWGVELVASGWAATVLGGSLFLLAAALMLWWWFPTLERCRSETLQAIGDAEAVFNEALQRAAVANIVPPAAASAVQTRLVSLRQQTANAIADDLDVYEEEAKTLARLRAYVLPPDALLPEAQLSLAAMKEWGVPADAVGNLEKSLLPVVSGTNAAAAKEALRAVFEEFDSWDVYVDWYASEYMPKLNVVFLWLITASVTLAVSRLVNQDVILGILFGGVSGALVSVVTRLPKFSIYGELSPALLGVFSRIATGLAATVIGIAFLASGIMTISITQTGSPGTEPTIAPLSRIIEVCGRPKAATPVAQRAGIVATAHAATADSADTPARGSTEKKPNPVTCGTGSLFLLLGIAMLLGFSERALPSFEEKLFPAKSK